MGVFLAKPSGFRFDIFLWNGNTCWEKHLFTDDIEIWIYLQECRRHMLIHLLLWKLSRMIYEVGKLFAVQTMVKTILCPLWHCISFVWYFSIIHLRFLMKVLVLITSILRFLRKFDMLSFLLCLHSCQADICRHSWKSADCVTCLWNVLAHVFLFCVCACVCVGGWMGQLTSLDQNENEDGSKWTLQCACHAGQLTLSWLSAAPVLCPPPSLLPPTLHRQTSPRGSEHSPPSVTPTLPDSSKWLSILLKVEPRIIWSRESCEFCHHLLVIDLSGRDKVVVRTCLDLPHGVVQLQAAGASRADSANSGTCSKLAACRVGRSTP